MNGFKKRCKENGIERFNTVKATVCDFNSSGTYVQIDGTDLVSFFHGGTAKSNSKVLIRIDGISERLERIYSSLDSVTEYSA